MLSFDRKNETSMGMPICTGQQTELSNLVKSFKEWINNMLENGLGIVLVYFDYQKVLDTEPYRRLATIRKPTNQGP